MASIQKAVSTLGSTIAKAAVGKTIRDEQSESIKLKQAETQEKIALTEERITSAQLNRAQLEKINAEKLKEAEANTKLKQEKAKKATYEGMAARDKYILSIANSPNFQEGLKDAYKQSGGTMMIVDGKADMHNQDAVGIEQELNKIQQTYTERLRSKRKKVNRNGK